MPRVESMLLSCPQSARQTILKNSCQKEHLMLPCYTPELSAEC